uniref:Pentatricopeptide repeat-containing protein n=1 Tax=Heterorhabditis bacteriophora TaxID=37862 RepID=A0A1I7WIQ5_HETBA
MRKLNRSDLESLRKLAGYFVQKGDYSLASRIYGSINDTKAMVQMYVRAGHWTDVDIFHFNQPFTSHSSEALLNMARYLSVQDDVPNISKVHEVYHHKAKVAGILPLNIINLTF